MSHMHHTRMVQLSVPYAYGYTICVYVYGMYHTSMKYAYGTEQCYDNRDIRYIVIQNLMHIVICKQKILII